MEASIKNIEETKRNFYYTNVDDVTEYQSRMKEVRARKESFGDQNIDVNDYIISPKGYEGVMLSIYFLLIPYLAGALFLFVFIAHVAFEKFLLLDLASLFIVWAIGYEVLALTLLTIIFISYLKYLKKSSKIK